MLKRAALAAACVVLVALWPGWRGEDSPYGAEIDADSFTRRLNDFTARHMVDGAVHPPPGPVPLIARRFEFWPPMVLETGKSYVLQVVAEDSVHSLALDGREYLLVPGRMTEIAVAPTAPGPLDVRCNEYCGLGHNKMRGQIVAR